MESISQLLKFWLFDLSDFSHEFMTICLLEHFPLIIASWNFAHIHNFWFLTTWRLYFEVFLPNPRCHQADQRWWQVLTKIFYFLFWLTISQITYPIKLWMVPTSILHKLPWFLHTWHRTHAMTTQVKQVWQQDKLCFLVIMYVTTVGWSIWFIWAIE